MIVFNKNKKFRDSIIRIFQKLLTLGYLSENKGCTCKELRNQGFGIPLSTIYKYLNEWEEENLIIKDGISREEKDYSHFNFSGTDSLSEFLSRIDQDIMEFLKEFYKKSIEKDYYLEKMRELMGEFEDKIIPNIIAQVKEDLAITNSQKITNTDFFKNLEDQIYHSVKSIVEKPFLKELVSKVSQRQRAREQT